MPNNDSDSVTVLRRQIEAYRQAQFAREQALARTPWADLYRTPPISPAPEKAKTKFMPREPRAIRLAPHGKLTPKLNHIFANHQLRQSLKQNAYILLRHYKCLNKDGILKPKPCIDYGHNCTPDQLKKGVGIELEVEWNTPWGPDRVPKLTKLTQSLDTEFAGQYFIHYDGSVHNGVEIVFTPIPVDQLRHHYSKFIRLFKLMRAEGMNADASGRCGLHMHFSKSLLSCIGAWKWLRSMVCTPNSQGYYDLANLSRRNGNLNYCWFSDDANDRYRAINLRPTNTAEMRFWAGTLDPKLFIGSLEVSAALVEYTKRHYYADLIPVMAEFWTWLRKARHKYEMGYRMAKGTLNIA